MKVDFNNLRLQTAFALDNVIKILNAGIMPEMENVYINDETKFRGDLLIDVSDLNRDMDSLRKNIIMLLACYEENNDEYKPLLDELEKNGGLATFNTNEE